MYVQHPYKYEGKYYARDKVITMDELEGFSADLIDAVKLILSR